jgi:thymidylate synthase
MIQYLALLQDVRTNGRFRADRTGTGTYGVFGRQARWDLSKGFPLLTTKKLFTRGIIAELIWILSGDTKEKTLRDQKVNIWAEWAPKGPELTVQERVAWLGDALAEEGAALVSAKHAPDVDAAVHKICDDHGAPRHEEGDGDLGRVYGKQWRAWRYAKDFGPDQGGTTDHNWAIAELDQITNLIHDLKNNPNSRRHIVTAWNPGELDQMALPPCHCFWQMYTETATVYERLSWFKGRDQKAYDSLIGTAPAFAPPEGIPHHEYMQLGEQHDTDYYGPILDGLSVPTFRLSCQLYQRSCDLFLGVPFNIASYSLLTMMIAQCVNMIPGDFVHTYGDLHIYANHLEQVDLQLTRTPGPLPKMDINPEVTDIFDFKVEDFKLVDYVAQPNIKAEVSV